MLSSCAVVTVRMYSSCNLNDHRTYPWITSTSKGTQANQLHNCIFPGGETESQDGRGLHAKTRMGLCTAVSVSPFYQFQEHKVAQ